MKPGHEHQGQHRLRQDMQRQHARPAGQQRHDDDRVGVDLEGLVQELEHPASFPWTAMRTGAEPPGMGLGRQGFWPEQH